MTYHIPAVDETERRRFLKAVGLTGAVAVTGTFTLDELRQEMAPEATNELATMGQAIQSDLTEQLDTTLLSTQAANIGAQLERLSEIRAAGIPTEESTLYRDLATPAWMVDIHLEEVGFFNSAEAHLPAFTATHIAATARELIRTESLTTALSELGFTEQEKTALVMNVVNNADRLALWVPTKDIPEQVEFNVDHVAPLHHRAAEGTLLWIDYLDRFLWQNEILITEQILDDGIRDVKTMLGGFYLLTKAVHDMIAGAELTNSQFTAALTASTAIMILGQEDITTDVFRITDEMRAPRTGGT
jgi:hypothetical protein